MELPTPQTSNLENSSKPEGIDDCNRMESIISSIAPSGVFPVTVTASPSPAVPVSVTTDVELKELPKANTPNPNPVIFQAPLGPKLGDLTETTMSSFTESTVASIINAVAASAAGINQNLWAASAGITNAGNMPSQILGPDGIPLPPILPPVKKKYKKNPNKEVAEKKVRKKKEQKEPKIKKQKLGTSIVKNKGSPKKRGRKSNEWYAVNNKLPGYSSSNKYNKKKKMRDYLDDGMLFAKTGPGPGLSSNSPLVGAPYYLTTKDILDLVFLDHNYCQVLYSTNRSKVQPFRHLFGPKDEYKAQFYPENLISPNKFLPPVPPTPAPPLPSKLEYLLKGGNASKHVTATKSTASPVRKYWEAHEETGDEIDVVTPESRDPIPYDSTKARNLMLQCDKHSKIIKPTNDDDDWETHVVRTGWTATQTKLYDDIIRALHGERLSRLAHDRNYAEPVLRRCSLDKTGQMVRTALCQVKWNTNLTQWLHGVLIDNLNQTYIAIYLDVLQTLRARSPTLVDKMIVLSTVPTKTSEPLPPIEALTSPNTTGDINSSGSGYEKNAANALKEVLAKKANNLSADALNLLLKKPWDPFSPVVHHTKLKRLACNPIFLYIPCISTSSAPATVRRFKNFYNMFSALGKVITLNILCSSRKVTVARFAARLLAVTKFKIAEIRRTYPDRSLYLIGWGAGSIIATTASVSQAVDGVIALAFPLFGIAGPRGTLEDPILDMKKPVLFIVGGRSADCSLTDMELLRKQLNCESSLVVIGCGDKNLLIERYHREKLLVTQSWVDKSIVNEVGYFINLHSKHQQVTAMAVMEKSVTKLGRTMPAIINPRSRNMSAGSSASVDMKPSPSLHGASDCSMDMDAMSFDSLDDSEMLFDAKSIHLFEKKGKKSNTTAKSKKKEKRPSGGSSSVPLQDDSSNVPRRPSTSSIIKQEPEPEFISPVLTYLGATSGQGGLLHGLLSPPIPAAGTSDTVLPFSSSATKAPIPKPFQPAVVVRGEKKKRTPRPKKPKVATTPAPPTDNSGPTTPTVLAGGATATPVSGPINSSTNISDSMRQYVLQHQQVIQKHLTHYQQQVQASSAPPTIVTSTTQCTLPGVSGQSHLMRLLSPSSIPNSPIPIPYAAPLPPLSAGQGKNIGENITLPSDLNVTVIKPPADASANLLQETAAHPQTTMISRQQLMSNLTTPILRLPQFTTTTTTNYNTTSTTISPGQIFQPRSFPMPMFSDNAQANVVFKAADKTIATNLRQADLKALFDGGVVRFVVPGESGQNIPVNIILKPQQPLISTTTTTNPNLPLNTISLASTTFASQSNATSTFAVMPQEAPCLTKPVQISKTSQGQDFGQIFRSPVDNKGNSNSQVPVSVLMPKTFVAREPISTTSTFSQATTKDTTVTSSSGSVAVKAETSASTTKQPLPIANHSENLKIVSVTSLAQSSKSSTPKPKVKSTKKSEDGSMKKTPIKRKSTPAAVKVKKSVDSKLINVAREPIVIGKKSTVKHINSDPDDEPLIRQIISNTTTVQKTVDTIKSTPTTITTTIPTTTDSFQVSVPILKEEQVIAKKSMPTPEAVNQVQLQLPIAVAVNVKGKEEDVGQVKRSLRPKSYPGPKRKRHSSGHTGDSPRKKQRPNPVPVVNSADTITTEGTVEPVAQGDEPLPSTQESQPKTPKKRTSTNTNSGGDSDETSTSRLTRSMRRQSSSGGS